MKYLPKVRKKVEQQPTIFDLYVSNCKIYVPMESVEAYKTAEYWSNYAGCIVGYDF